MIIAGAGGHGFEVALILEELGFNVSELFFFDENKTKSYNSSIKSTLILELEDLEKVLKIDPRFVLGVGNPVYREKLFHLLASIGGKPFGINCIPDHDSTNSNQIFDAMPYTFIGAETIIGNGVLLNTRANIHHECVVGEFSEVGPGAMLLGAVKIGAKCRIGAGAVLLPGVKLGDEVVVGAGAVVTKNVLSGKTVKGIPAK